MSEQNNTPKYNETSILDVLLILARNKWMLIKITGVITIIALGLSLTWPHTYKSTATFLPPKDQQVGGLPGGLLGNLMQTQISTSKLNAESILTIMRSRSLQTDVINTMGLQEDFNSTIMEELLMKFNNALSISDVREGGFGFNPVIAVEVSFTSKYPERAQEVLEYVLAVTDSVAKKVTYKNNFERFEIVENRFHRNVEELAAAEDALKEFQEKHGLFELREQSVLMIEQLAEVRAAMTEAEMKINLLRQTVSSDNRELQNQIRTRNELRNQYDKMLQNSEGDVEVTGFDVFRPMTDMPELGQQFLRLFREVQIQNTIYEYLYPQYEQTKMLLDDSSRNLQIIDEAHLPTYKDGPKRAFIVIGGFMAGLFISLLLIGFREIARRGAEDEDGKYQKVNELFSAITSGKDY